MKYIGTRGAAPAITFEQAVFAGLAPDGGLYLPEKHPTFSRELIRSAATRSYEETATDILSLYTGNCISKSDLGDLIQSAYASFRHPAITPLTQLGQGDWLLELYHGPTLAFKDVALQLLGKIFAFFLKRRGEKLTVIGATSGDTGSAAISGLAGVENTETFIFFPNNRTSEVQRKQMTTVNAANVHAIALEGNFDDCQNIVKTLFADADFRKKVNLGAVNSINWARVAAQIVYYVTSASALGAPEHPVSFSVPTGNFGDILAGYNAARAGLPIAELIIACNRNDLLARLLETGSYTPEEARTSLSPSMDIQISSNFERLLFDACNGNPETVARLIQDLKEKKSFTLPQSALAYIRAFFSADRASDAETAQTIRDVYQKTGRLIDPHTAVGVAVGRKARKSRNIPLINLACASPAKFPDAVRDATGETPQLPHFLKDLHERKENMSVLPNDIEAVKSFILQQ